MALTSRWDYVFVFLLHTWLKAEGQAGLELPPAPKDDSGPPPALSGDEIATKIALRAM